MSPRPNVTFSKRQKELARQEKQRAKALRKLQRKAENLAAANQPEFADTPENEALPPDAPVEASNSQATLTTIPKEQL